jgi:hypothetical protein
LKTKLLPLPAAAAALLGAALFVVTTMAQAAQPAQGQTATPHQHPPAPPPTNLKVLPKNLTGEQVHEIMHKWEADLGVECSMCHASDPKNIGPNGRPRLNFADDTKKEKATARLMFTMMEDINKNYVSKVEGEGGPVTCGTCHRGHAQPEAFVPPPDHEHEHEHPQGAPGQQPPVPH